MTAAHRHVKTIEIRWSDLDGYAHVNHARFLTYVEEGRDEWLTRLVGPAADDFLIARVAIDYRSQLVLADDEVLATIELERLGTSSVATVEQLHARSDGRLVAECRAVVVYTGADHVRAVPLPPALRACFELPA